MSRILQSELLLRTEAPLEFLRRIAERETLYMETEHSDPNEQTIYRVMISMSPAMLGHGRLVALAALFFLARVAKDRNAKLHWCYLPQSENMHWFNGITVNGVKRFLKFGSFASAADEDLDEAAQLWTSVFGTAHSKDLLLHDWVIGAARSRSAQAQGRAPKNALSLSLSPPTRGLPRQGGVDLQKNGVNLRRIAITFPDDRVCTSALNRPFQPVSPKSKTGENAAASLPVIGGWEPLYHYAFGTDRHIIRLEKQGRRGLLFIIKGSNDNALMVSHLPLPDDVQLAGVYYSADNQRIAILVQRTRGQTEELIYNIFHPNQDMTGKPKQKAVISEHLFAKQRAYAIPSLHPSDSTQCYTTMGQPFDLSFEDENTLNMTLQYKEKRIVQVDGNHRILHFHPDGKTLSEITAQGDKATFSSPSIQIYKSTTKRVGAYPVEEGFDFNRLCGLVFSRSNRGLAYSLYPGRWRIFERNVGSDAEDFSQNDLMLEPYERVLSSHMARDGVKLMIYSDAAYGGTGYLQTRVYSGDDIVSKNTLYKFGKAAEHISSLRLMTDGSIWGIKLGMDGDPEEVIVLRRSAGHYRKKTMVVSYLFERAKTISPEAVFGE